MKDRQTFQEVTGGIQNDYSSPSGFFYGIEIGFLLPGFCNDSVEGSGNVSCWRPDGVGRIGVDMSSRSNGHERHTSKRQLKN